MRWILLAIALFAAHPALAVKPEEMLADPELEARAREISKDIRCLVCRNESIDDSSASLARDLRLLVRERVLVGDSNEEVVDYLVDRYGEFVLLNPRFNAGNMVIWLAGRVLLIVGGVGAFLYIRRQRSGPIAVAGLSDEEKARLDELTRD